MRKSTTEFSWRQLGALIALWIGWTLAFALVQAGIDAVLRSAAPRILVGVAILAVALGAIAFAATLWDGWRGGLGLIAILFAVLTGIVGVFRLPAVSPWTTYFSLGLTVVGSVVIGFVLLHAERLRTGR